MAVMSSNELLIDNTKVMDSQPDALQALSAQVEDLCANVSDGLRYTHHGANANTSKTLEVTAFAYALIELLIEKGLLTEEELNERKRQVMERLAEKFRNDGMGVVRMEPEYDKYTFDQPVTIDCASRIAHCRAACCRLQFALSRQDVEEGIVQWDFAHPYMIRQTKQGYCTHLADGACACSIYVHRPLACRAYDCRKDQRIWQDFDQMIINPDLAQRFGEGGDDV